MYRKSPAVIEKIHSFPPVLLSIAEIIKKLQNPAKEPILFSKIICQFLKPDECNSP